MRKLWMINAATTINDLWIPPSNKLKALKGDQNKMEKIKAIHPGEILNKEFLAILKISQYRLAKDISVPPRRINEIVHGTRRISADTALRLARYFGNSPKFWLNLQAHYDLEKQRELLGGKLECEVKVLEKAKKSFV